MQFSTVFALAAAIVGVSADVHSHCQCIHSETGYVDLVTSVKACTYYPRNELYTSNEKLITDQAEIAKINLDIDADEFCETTNIETGEVVAHLGGDQFQTACTRNAPDNVKVHSECK